MRVFSVQSPHERCGVGEYGRALDAALRKAGVEVATRQYGDPLSDGIRSGDALLVHFEDGLAGDPARLNAQLVDIKRAGANIVFCCHRYEKHVLEAYAHVVGRFVLHRDYEPRHGYSVILPLGCPVYEPRSERRALRAALRLPEDKVVVTTLGFISGWKSWPEVLACVTAVLPPNAFLQVQTPPPFVNMNESRRIAEEMRAACAPLGDRVRFSTEFVPESELLDRVYASDMGFVYHPNSTGSVSAATKAMVSGRCPTVVTNVNHASDMVKGVVRSSPLAKEFARDVADLARDDGRRRDLQAEMQHEYERLNMDVVAVRYIALFRELGCG